MVSSVIELVDCHNVVSPIVELLFTALCSLGYHVLRRAEYR